jgi:hypothetical protein
VTANWNFHSPAVSPISPIGNPDELKNHQLRGSRVASGGAQATDQLIKV